MPDIQLRFHKDMLVLSAPIDAALRARGFGAEGERELLVATEPETVLEPLRLEMVAGAQCLVLPTEGITRARLSHVRAEDKAGQIAKAALSMVAELSPQHVLVEVGPTGLPIDASSKASLMANRDQYADAARLFAAAQVDALFLNNLAGVDDLRCALMGVRKVFDLPVFVSVAVSDDGCLRARGESLSQMLAVVQEYGADVVGVQSAAGPEATAAVVAQIAKLCDLPILVQLEVVQACEREPRNPVSYWCAELAARALPALRDAGAQFVRACGEARSSYTGALAAASFGLDCVR